MSTKTTPVSYDLLQMLASTSEDAAQLVYALVPELKQSDSLAILPNLTKDQRASVRDMSEMLFGDSEAFEVIGKNTPEDYAYIRHRAIRVKGMDIQLVKIDDDRTAIVFYKK